MRAIHSLSVALAMGILIGLVAAPACKSLPEKVCVGDRANVLTTGGQPDAGADPSCSGCLQALCCDEVGRCDESPSTDGGKSCLDGFKEAHACVLAKGPGAESECTSGLGPSTSSLSRTLYTCMRTNCGRLVAAESPCKVSNCNVLPAVVQLSTPACDRCLGGSCCQPINECYGDRRCKLAVECIVNRCRGTLGEEMAQFGASGPQTIANVRNAICVDRVQGPADGLPNPAGSCVIGCLGEFAPFDGTEDDQAARCLAFDVYACGARSGCGDACRIADAGAPPPDGGTGPTDAGPDATR